MMTVAMRVGRDTQQRDAAQRRGASADAMLSAETNNNQIFGDIQDDPANDSPTPIQEFYSGQKIFITGGTGFLGKILVEKLLRSCPDVSTIYLLVRPKKGKTVISRTEEMFKDRVYDRLKKEVPKFRDKVVALNGDCCLPNLGLSDADMETLKSEVSIVFHVAATVNFNENLKQAMAVNVHSTGEILKMCKDTTNLKSVVYVSTAYANSHLNSIQERFYTYPVEYKDITNLVNSLPDDKVDEMTPSIIGQWPNTYTFTKAAAEALIREQNHNLPIGIFRPAIVTSTEREPLAGWVDNLYGPMGIVTGVCKGMIRIVNCDPDVAADIVPVDSTVNALIASAWDIYTQTKRRNESMLIYNFVSSVDAPLCWDEFTKTNMRHSRSYPTSTCLWYPMLILVKWKVAYTIMLAISHWLPGLLMDIMKICVGQKPSVWRSYEKIHTFLHAISYFSTNQWKFSNDNVTALWQKLHSRDQQIFWFTMKGFDWDKYFNSYVLGIRIYMLKDDLSTLQESKVRQKRLFWLHYTVKTIAMLAGAWFLWSVFWRLFGLFNQFLFR